MVSGSWYAALVMLEFALAVPTFVVLRFVTAPYGRHHRAGWGPVLPARLGWLLMESPAVILVVAVFLAGRHRGAPVPLVLLALWLTHYLYRAVGYPLLLRPGAGMPAAVAAMAFGFNLLNGWINARWISELGAFRTGWLVDPRFLAGAVLFLAGFALHVTADRSLRRLRRPGETGYAIPRGGAFELVSCPNYLGETVQWLGWALASWSPAGLAFAVYTVANLTPRALSHHEWYREQFPEYPPRRRALIPYLR